MSFAGLKFTASKSTTKRRSFAFPRSKPGSEPRRCFPMPPNFRNALGKKGVYKYRAAKAVCWGPGLGIRLDMGSLSCTYSFSHVGWLWVPLSTSLGIQLVALPPIRCKLAEFVGPRAAHLSECAHRGCAGFAGCSIDKFEFCRMWIHMLDFSASLLSVLFVCILNFA